MNGKKLIALIFAMLMLVSMCSCASQGTAEPAETTKATTAAATAAAAAEEPVVDPYAEHMEISWLGYSMKDGFEEGSRVQKYLEDMFNVTFTIPEFLDWRNREQVSLMVSSGIFPDYVGVLRYADIKDVYESGLTREIPIQIIRENAPDLALMMDEKGGWLVDQIQGTETLYGIPMFYELEYEETGLFLRYDWLEAVGIEPNGEVTDLYNGDWFTCSEPFTLDELVTILEKFVQEDPDNNGENDTIGLEKLYYNFASCFGLQMGWDHNRFEYGNVLEDGQAVPWWASKKQKDMLAFFKTLYDKGLLTDDAVIGLNDSSNSSLYWESNKCGATISFTYALGMDGDSNFSAPIFANVEDAKVLIAPVPLNPDTGLVASEPEFFTKYGSPWASRDSSVIGADVDDAKLSRILSIFNYINCTYEGFIPTRYGFEGTDFTWKGTPLESGISFVEDFDKVECGQSMFSCYFLMPKYFDIALVYGKPEEPIFKTWAKDQYFLGLEVCPYKLDLLNESDIISVQQQYTTDLTALTQKYYVDVIMGNVDLEATFDDYIDSLNNAGLQQWIEEINKGVITSEYRNGNIVH